MFTPQLLLIGLAVFLLVIALPTLVSPKAFIKAMKSFSGDKNNVRMAGFFSMIIGLFFLAIQWQFSKDWMVLIPILGWLSVLKGIFFVWYPAMPKQMMKTFKLDKEHTAALYAILMIVMAAGLIYVATEILVMGEVVAG